LWEGTDNGGATTKGVTRDEIVIAVPGGASFSENDRTLEAYFNKRYEFYGRKLRLVPSDHPPAFTTGDKMQGAAVKVDEEVKAFASLSIGFQQGQEGVYYDALARRGIISVAGSFTGPSSAFESDYARNAPYGWNYGVPLDLIEKSMAEVICNQLVGRSAKFAGGSEALKKRRFGLIIDAAVKGAPPVTGEPLLSISKRCGAEWDPTYNIVGDPTAAGDRTNKTKDAVTRMQGNGVTTIVCLCYSEYVRGAMDNSYLSSPPYQPEWFLSPYGDQDTDKTVRNFPTPQNDHIISLRMWNKPLPRAQSAHWIAKREVNPTAPPDIQNFDTGYWNLLVLASGIQLAGPNLTPQTFEQGLQRARFPNPGCGGPPEYQACVGFEGGTHTMIKDLALTYFDPSGKSLEYDYTLDKNAFIQAKGQGAYCFAGQGTRYRLGTWPKGEPLSSPCK